MIANYKLTIMEVKHLQTFYRCKQLLMFLAFILPGTLAISQDFNITGKVSNGASSTPLSGVTVRVKEKQTATTTKEDGTFTITAPKGSTLVFTHVGYALREVAVTNNAKVEIQLSASAGGLDEVVVVGYGTKRKRDITSAISTVNMADIGEAPSRGVTQLLQGQAPGVVVKQKDGRPGAEFEVRVRGISSLGAGSEPLYVIDGFAMGTNAGVNVNPNDIESISILKDAAATAIYGARGSNGVVLITTRSAKEGQTRLNVSVDYGIQNIPKSRRVTVLTGPEFAQFKKEVWMDNVRYFQNREPSINEVPIGFRYPEQTKYSTNWFNEILHNNAPYTDYNISLASGSGPIKSVLSIGYYKEEGAIIKTNYDRFSIRANIGGQVNKFITMGWNTAATYSRQNLTNTDGRNAIVGSTLIMDPREPMYDSTGAMRPYIGGVDGVFGYPNPVYLLNHVTNKRNIADILSNGFIEMALIKNSRFRSSANVRLNYNNFRFFQPSTIGNLLGSGQSGAPPKLAQANENTDQLLNYSLDQLLTYAPNIGENHTLDFLAGFTAQEETTRGISGSGNTFPDDLVPYLGAAILRSSNSFELGWSLLAYIGRVNYAFQDKYLLSASMRREGSSRFGSKNKYGNFPAASIGWRLTK
ncbi:MAG: SusC/RagA family TonB-linked outer membrane protein, partial [Segetibacter sp.]